MHCAPIVRRFQLDATQHHAMHDEPDTSEDTARMSSVAAWTMPSYDDEAGRKAYNRLKADWMAGAIVDAQLAVQCPADQDGQPVSIAELLLRDFNGPRGAAMLCAVVRSLSQHESGLRMLDWLASEHAARHWQALRDKYATDDTAA